MPHLHSNWVAILKLSWSIRLALLAAVLSGAEVACSVLAVDPPIRPVWFAALSATITIAAAIARLFAQRNLRPPQ